MEKFPGLRVKLVCIERDGSFNAKAVVVQNGSPKQWREPLVELASSFDVSRKRLEETTLAACDHFEAYFNGHIESKAIAQ